MRILLCILWNFTLTEPVNRSFSYDDVTNKTTIPIHQSIEIYKNKLLQAFTNQ